MLTMNKNPVTAAMTITPKYSISLFSIACKNLYVIGYFFTVPTVLIDIYIWLYKKIDYDKIDIHRYTLYCELALEQVG